MPLEIRHLTLYRYEPSTQALTTLATTGLITELAVHVEDGRHVAYLVTSDGLLRIDAEDGTSALRVFDAETGAALHGSAAFAALVVAVAVAAFPLQSAWSAITSREASDPPGYPPCHRSLRARGTGRCRTAARPRQREGFWPLLPACTWATTT